MGQQGSGVAAATVASAPSLAKPRVLYSYLKAAGWKLSKTGWHKRGWCFVPAWQALAVEEAFSKSRTGYWPQRTLASPIQIAAARQAVERAQREREASCS